MQRGRVDAASEPQEGEPLSAEYPTLSAVNFEKIVKEVFTSSCDRVHGAIGFYLALWLSMFCNA